MSTFEFTIDNCILINKQQIKFYTSHLSDRKNSKEIAGEKNSFSRTSTFRHGKKVSQLSPDLIFLLRSQKKSRSRIATLPHHESCVPGEDKS